MNYCKSCDIAYEENYCPLCEANSEIEELKRNLNEAQEKIAELEEK
jgi:hypothetical protein